jgi:hypothetical protein
MWLRCNGAAAMTCERGPTLEHDPEKACPGLDPEWKPIFGKDHAQTKKLDLDPIQSNRIKV